MQVIVRFTTVGCMSGVGNFEPGDRLRCSADYARHLVEQARCARYEQEPAATPQPADPPARRPRQRKAAQASTEPQGQPLP